jgi:hypothetical protein
MKAVVYKNARKQGLSVEDAEAKAHYALFDYSKVPPAIRWARDFYSPFITFSYKALPRLAKQATRRPWKMAPYYAGIYLAQELSDFMLGDDDEDRERKRRLLPEYMQRNTLPGHMPSHIRMPFQTKDGRDKYLDLSFWLPWGGATDMADGALGWVPSYLAPSSPLFTVPASLLTNSDIFTGQPIILDTDSDGRKAVKIGLKLYNEIAPTILSTQKWSKMIGAVYGTKNVLGQPKYSVIDAMLDLSVGIKFRNVDYMEQSMWRQKDLQKKMQEIRKDIGSRMNKYLIRDNNLPWNQNEVDTKEDLMEEYMDRISDVYEEFQYRFQKENENE